MTGDALEFSINFKQVTIVQNKTVTLEADEPKAHRKLHFGKHVLTDSEAATVRKVATGLTPYARALTAPFRNVPHFFDESKDDGLVDLQNKMSELENAPGH